ncbi:MAG: hypothetical protein ACRCS0_13640 [Albidovulum sp.]
MLRVLKILLWLLGLAVLLPVLTFAAVFGWLWWTAPHFAWRQKMTVTVETPAGEVSGSSVSQIGWQEQAVKFEGMGWNYDVTGEAVVVEVAPGRWLFALLTGAGTTEYMGSVAAASISGQHGRVISEALFDEVSDKRGRAAGPITVPDYQYPLLVTFDDIADPKTVRRVDPANLSASFGQGVSLKAVTLAVTEEPVTEGRVEGVLGNLAQIGRQVDPATRIQYPPGFADAEIPSDAKYFDVSSFKTGLYK